MNGLETGVSLEGGVVRLTFEPPSLRLSAELVGPQTVSLI